MTTKHFVFRLQLLAIASLSVLVDGEEGKDFLAEKYEGLIENVQAKMISNIFKNTELSGDPEAGTLKAKRFTNAKSQAYGTARTSGRGQYLKDKGVAIDIDVDREIVEEIEEKDVRLLGVEGLVSKRSANHEQSMVRELDGAFFECAAKEGTSVDVSGLTETKDKLDKLILTLHKTKNDYVDGVDKENIHVTLSPDAYEDMRDYIDTKSNANVDTSVEEFGKYHGVHVYSNIHQPEGVEMIAMCMGSIAQPVMPSPYEPSRIPLSKAIAIELYYSYGTKAVMPDLIYYVGTYTDPEEEETDDEEEDGGGTGLQTQSLSAPVANEADLSGMTVAQLKEFATENGYNVTATTKAEIVSEIQDQIQAENI
jgi:hypothetical protein